MLYKKNSLLTKFNLKTKSSAEERMFYFYRFISLALTSSFYLIGPPYAPVHFKLLVVCSLFLSSLIITRLYITNREAKSVIKILILLETLGITFLLLPTGGLDSPFIWYALNPVLLAGRYFRRYFCWLTLLFFMCSAMIMSLFFFNKESMSLVELISNYSHLILILVLITLAIQLLSELMRALDEKANLLKVKSQRLIEANERLEELNKQSEQSVEYIMSLYQMIEAFTDRENRDDLPQLFADYTQKITRSISGFFYLKHNTNDKYQFAVAGERDIELLHIKQSFEKLHSSTEKTKLIMTNQNFLVVPFKTAYNQNGLIGIKFKNMNQEDIENAERKLLFLSDLNEVILERFHLENLSSELMISEEQNRIANEMHDSVSQRLFAIVYAIHALSVTHNNLPENEVHKQLQSIKGSAHSAIQELRSTIHQLSIRKRQEKPFKMMVEQFLLEQTNLYNASLDLNLVGDESRLSSSLKQGIYRMICEGSGNALRHGLCKHLHILLSIGEDRLTLFIKDDGQGFILENETSGLGLTNIRHLASKFGGTVVFQSELSKGTSFTVNIPLYKDSAKNMNCYKEVAI